MNSLIVAIYLDILANTQAVRIIVSLIIWSLKDERTLSMANRMDDFMAYCEQCAHSQHSANMYNGSVRSSTGSSIVYFESEFGRK